LISTLKSTSIFAIGAATRSTLRTRVTSKRLTAQFTNPAIGNTYGGKIMAKPPIKSDELLLDEFIEQDIRAWIEAKNYEPKQQDFEFEENE
jgi:hypothetical protein